MAVTDDGHLYTWGQALEPNPRKHAIHRYTGLGHRRVRLFPTMISPNYMQGARVGLYHNLLPNHALAFAMSAHSRLGKGALMNFEKFPELLKMVVDLCQTRTDEGTGETQGLVRLMGGGMIPSPVN